MEGGKKGDVDNGTVRDTEESSQNFEHDPVGTAVASSGNTPFHISCPISDRRTVRQPGFKNSPEIQKPLSLRKTRYTIK